MKQYVWIAIMLIFVDANATDNPFDLNTNLKKVDQDQDELLFELKAIAEVKEKREEQEELEKEKIEVKTPEVVVTEPKITEEERVKKEKLLKEEYAEIRRERLEKEN